MEIWGFKLWSWGVWGLRGMGDVGTRGYRGLGVWGPGMCRGPGAWDVVCEEAGRESGAGCQDFGDGRLFFCGSANQKGELRNLAFSFVTRFALFRALWLNLLSLLHRFGTEISIHEYSFWPSFLMCLLTPYRRE